MEIFLKNNLSGEKEAFQPIKPPLVRMYNCGPTVYGRGHIGNLRSYVFADLLRRLFEFNGYEVQQVINITDVGHLTGDSDDGEDKVERAARERGERAAEITKRFAEMFMEDISALNIDPKKIKFVKATDHIADQIVLIEKLETNGLTYRTSDGIYFDTKKFPRYGKLGQIDLAGLKEGARVQKNSDKHSPTDFALWKFSRPEENREQEWNSPWGIGYPGWHIECSAMSVKYLGQPFDVHTGGIDHIPVHHNNEIAQSEGATMTSSGETTALANFWMHNNHVLILGEKISKSIGNDVYISDIKDVGINPLAYRYWLLTSHYSTLINYSGEAIRAAATAFEKLIEKIDAMRDAEGNTKSGTGSDTENYAENAGAAFSASEKNYLQKIHNHLNDDLNTPAAIATIWELIKDDSVSVLAKLIIIFEADRVLGLDLKNQSSAGSDFEIPEAVKELVKARETARKSKNYTEADRLRDEISAAGFDIKDEADGQVVRKK